MPVTTGRRLNHLHPTPPPGDADGGVHLVGAGAGILHVYIRLAVLHRRANGARWQVLRSVYGRRSVQLHITGWLGEVGLDITIRVTPGKAPGNMGENRYCYNNIG